jgi:hypothetical protein
MSLGRTVNVNCQRRYSRNEKWSILISSELFSHLIYIIALAALKNLFYLCKRYL